MGPFTSTWEELEFSVVVRVAKVYGLSEVPCTTGPCLGPFTSTWEELEFSAVVRVAKVYDLSEVDMYHVPQDPVWGPSPPCGRS